MKRVLVLYVVTALVLLALDGAWLGYLARDFFRTRLAHLMAAEIDLRVAALFYLIYPAGILIFAGLPRYDGDWIAALGYGALFGFFVYATYDLTNLATLRDWPVAVAVVDVAWGTLATGLAAAAGVAAARALD